MQQLCLPSCQHISKLPCHFLPQSCLLCPALSRLQEDWSQTAPWRAYYSQHGLQPLRREHTLPEPLVRKFIAGPLHADVAVAELDLQL
jgi:hypothetical protein